MFKNLLAEMSRNGITRKDIAVCLGVSEKTVRNYINGTTLIPWSATQKVRNSFFPDLDIEYLFSDKKQSTSRYERLQ